MDAIGKVVAPVKEAFSEIFPPADGEHIYSFAERLDLMTQKLIITDQTAEKIKKTFKGLFTVLKGVTTILSKIGAVAKEAFSLLANAAKPVAQVMLSVGAGLGDFLETIYKVATGSGHPAGEAGRHQDGTDEAPEPCGCTGQHAEKHEDRAVHRHLPEKGREEHRPAGYLVLRGQTGL